MRVFTPLYKIVDNQAVIMFTSLEQANNHSHLYTFKWDLEWVLWLIFVYRMNKRGENTHPCGEPMEEHTLSDKTPLTLTLCVLFVSKFKIQPTRFLLSSKSLCVKMCGWIVLKAGEKSINKSRAWHPFPSRCLKSKLIRVSVTSSTLFWACRQIAVDLFHSLYFSRFPAVQVFQKCS